MKTITSEELLARTDDNNMDNLQEVELVNVICHNGEKITTNRHIQYLHAFLHYNRAYNVPVYIEQVFDKDFAPTPKNYITSMEDAIEIVHGHLQGSVPKHEIATNWVDCTDVLTNAVIADIERFSASIDAEDIMEILTDPHIIEMRTEMKDILAGKEGPEIKSNAIIDCNDSLIKYITVNGNTCYPHNGIFQHIAAGSIKLDQLCQLINVVGYVTEIDSEIYPIPTAESFAEGMNWIYPYATNASLGKKAVMYNKSPIADTETLNRLVQQMCSQIENVHIGDCGSTKTSPILLTKHVLKGIVGMYHIRKDGVVEEITKDIALANKGKVLDVRTTAGCDTEDPVGICDICGGSSTRNFVDHYNVGGASSCLILSKNSQQILKTKHVEIINFVSGLSLNPQLTDFMRISENGKEIYINDSCSRATISFMATRRNAKEKATNGKFLQTLFSVKDFKETDLVTFTNIGTINFNPNNGLDDEVIDVRIKTGSTAHFSEHVLEYIRNNPEKLTMYIGKRSIPYYTLDLHGFDTEKALMSMPFKHYDSLSLHHQLETFFMSPKDKPDGEVLTDYKSFGAALTKLTDMTYGRLGVPMGLLQLMILPFSFRDPTKSDYRMTNNGDYCEFGKMEFVRRVRSLSVVTISNNQSKVYGHFGPLVHDKMMPHRYDSHFTNT